MSDVVESQATEQPAQATGQESPEVAKYTDKQLNDLIAKNAAKAAEKARAELLGSIGVKDESEIEALKKAREAQMTEAEKLKAELDAERESRKSDAKKTETAELRAAAYESGVPKALIDRVIKISAGYEGDTAEERVAAVLADMPEFIKNPVKDIGAPAHGQGVDDNTAMLETIRGMHKKR